MSNDINLATLWVPVVPETSAMKGQLAAAGEEGAAIFGQAFLGSGVFKDIGRQLQAVITAGAPEGRRALDLLTAGHRDLSKAAGDSADAASRASNVFNTLGVASVVAFGGAIAVSAKAAGDFEASMTRLSASAGESASNLQAVGDGILQLAGKVGYGPQQLADAMYMVEKAGYRGADGVNVLTAAAQGAKSENADLKEVLNGLTTSMHDFGYGVDQSADVMSKLVAASGMAKANFQDFTGALHSAEPIAAAIGKSQGLNEQQLQRLSADVLGIGAQMTQTGMSADQSFQLMGHAFQKLLGPTQQMRDTLGALGLDAQDLSDHLGERGLANTLQIVQQAIQQHTKDGVVNLDVMYQSQQAARAEAEAFNALPGPVKAVAQQIKDHTLSYKDFRKSRGGLDVEMANELGQWNALNNKVTGFSSAIKAGIGDHLSYDQVLKMVTGDQETLQVALQTTGDNAGQTNDKIQQIDQTTREHDGTVKGFNETQQTLNAKMADFKAAMESARIELGTAFLPALTAVAGMLANVGQFLAEHKDLAEHLTEDIGLLAGAWLLVKGAMIGQEIWMGIAGAMDAVGAKVGIAATATKGLAMAETDVAAGSGAAAAGIETLGASATGAQAGVAGLSRLLGPLMAAFLVIQNGPDIQKWIEDHVPGASFLDSLPNPSDWGHNTRQWFDQNILGDTPPGAPPSPPPPGTPFNPTAILSPGNTAPPPGGLPGILPHAAGGVLPGYSPGVDNLLGSLNGKLVGLSGGEGILVPEVVKALGPGFVHGLNARYAGHRGAGMRGHFAGGGTTPDSKDSTSYLPIDEARLAWWLSEPGWNAYKMWQYTGERPGNDPGIKIPNGTSRDQIDWRRYPDAMQPHLSKMFQRVQGATRGGILGFSPGGIIPGGDGADLPTEPGTYVVTPENIQTAEGFAQSVSGKAPYGPAAGPTMYDCSGFMSAIYGILTGRSMPTGVRYFTTEADFTKLGFMPGYDPNSPFNIGVHHGGPGGGHMAGTLMGVNVESGGGTGGGPTVGPGAAGATNSEFEQHYHLPGSMSGMRSGAVDEHRVDLLNTKISTLEGDIQVLEQKKSEETDKTKQSEKTRIDNELNTKNAELAQAKEDLAAAEQGTYKSGRGSRGTNKTESEAQQFGSGLLKGLMSDLGFGNVLGGKSPLDWGIVKLLGGLASWGLGEANAVGDAMGGGQPGMGGSILSGAFGAIPGVKSLMPHNLGPAALAPSAVSASMANPNDVAVGRGSGPAPGPVTNDNRIIVQGNQMTDPNQLVPPMQAQMNANTASRASTGLITTGPGGG